MNTGGEKREVTVRELARELERRLDPIYGSGEARAMVRLIFHHLKGWDATQLIINDTLPVSQRMLDECAGILRRLEQHEPLQYILGEARFYGMDFKVTPAVLIPRPETAELVDVIVRDNQRDDLHVLDIGTGSGAIAVALARNLPFTDVTAMDISLQALDVARANARALHARISFLHADIFDWQPPRHLFDIVVSNPPYICEKEKAEMDANVLDYEPSTALFVPDDDPLRYYARIADVSLRALRPGGKLYFEINPLYVRQLTDMLTDKGYVDVESWRDSQGRIRFVCANIANDNRR